MFRDRVVEPRRAVTRSIIERGIAEGSIRPDVDVDAVIGMLAAPVIVAVMTHGETPADPPARRVRGRDRAGRDRAA